MCWKVFVRMVEKVQLLRSIILTLITECKCNPDGTVNPNVCNTNTGECLCKENWTGLKCESAGTSIFLDSNVNTIIFVKYYSHIFWYELKFSLALPRILCNGNGVLPHLQMGVAITGFVEDFCYGLHNS